MSKTREYIPGFYLQAEQFLEVQVVQLSPLLPRRESALSALKEDIILLGFGAPHRGHFKFSPVSPNWHNFSNLCRQELQRNSYIGIIHSSPFDLYYILLMKLFYTT